MYQNNKQVRKTTYLGVIEVDVLTKWTVHDSFA